MKKNNLLLILFIFTFPIAFSQLKINELMSNNVSAVLDDSYNYSMWIELYNPSTSNAYNQSAYYFTNDKSFPKKWKASNKVIAPGSYSILWFERDDRDGHSNFKLDPEGGELFLFSNTLLLIDSVKYPSQYRNVSYGRLTDGSDSWVYFEQHSAGATNNNKQWSFERCSEPEFIIPGGVFSSVINLEFKNSQKGETIYYTLNGSEPTINNALPYSSGSVISLNATSIVRAKTISNAKMSSDIVSNTYFIDMRDIKLPIVSIITQQENLTGETLGIYVAGSNGISGNGSDVPVNWNQDWDRPVNFELYDTTKTCQVNQELDISIAGGWSRLNGQKSLKISPRSKFGNNMLDYDFFHANKPNHLYKDIQLRNSGNDFFYSMLRDAYMESLIINRMDLDYLAYEPAVCYINGVYHGIQNLRERSNADFIFSNYGYKEDDIYIVENWMIPYDPNYIVLTDYISNNDMTKSEVYNKVCDMMDVDNYINYMIAQIYFGNMDWPNNNIKIWKKRDGGKWRWILFDTDFGFNLYDKNLHNFNSLLYVLGETDSDLPEWSTLLMRRLLLNSAFKTKFIDRFAIHLSSTFERDRANYILDSMVYKIADEISYHKAKWGSNRSLVEDVNNMKTFSANRPGKMLEFLNNRLGSSNSSKCICLNSNVSNSTFTFNSEFIKDDAINLNYFTNDSISITANSVLGYKFKHWELNSHSISDNIVPMGSRWNYFDGNAMPANNWYKNEYNDTDWETGVAQLGYGNKGEVTTIDYGGEATDKNTAAYFRKSFIINGIDDKTYFSATILVDDAAALFINGHEIGRFNLPIGTLNFNTLALNYNNGERTTFSIPKTYLVEGENLIAVEVHQISTTSSDLMFDLELNYEITSDSSRIVTTPIYKAILTEDFSLKAIYEIATEVEENVNTIKINEVLSHNNLISDDFNEFDDYVELYNYGENEVNIAGWYLSDYAPNKLATQIPSSDSSLTRIPAKGRIVLWADNQPEQGVLHCGLKISKKGEQLFLSKRGKFNIVEIVDSVTVPALDYNITYSRVPDGDFNWMIRNTTFNESNGVLASLNSIQSTIKVFPTCVKEFLYVKYAEGHNLSVYDLTGRVVYNRNRLSDNEVIEMSGFRTGWYIVRVGSSSFKVVKM